jgi:hypothetical protein
MDELASPYSKISVKDLNQRAGNYGLVAERERAKTHFSRQPVAKFNKLGCFGRTTADMGTSIDIAEKQVAPAISCITVRARLAK